MKVACEQGLRTTPYVGQCLRRSANDRAPEPAFFRKKKNQLPRSLVRYHTMPSDSMEPSENSNLYLEILIMSHEHTTDIQTSFSLYWVVESFLAAPHSLMEDMPSSQLKEQDEEACHSTIRGRKMRFFAKSWRESTYRTEIDT